MTRDFTAEDRGRSTEGLPTPERRRQWEHSPLPPHAGGAATGRPAQRPDGGGDLRRLARKRKTDAAADGHDR